MALDAGSIIPQDRENPFNRAAQALNTLVGRYKGKLQEAMSSFQNEGENLAMPENPFSLRVPAEGYESINKQLVLKVKDLDKGGIDIASMQNKIKNTSIDFTRSIYTPPGMEGKITIQFQVGKDGGIYGRILKGSEYFDTPNISLDPKFQEYLRENNQVLKYKSTYKR